MIAKKEKKSIVYLCVALSNIILYAFVTLFDSVYVCLKLKMYCTGIRFQCDSNK